MDEQLPTPLEKHKFQRKVTKEQERLIEQMTDQGFTYESIADSIKIPVSTVGYYAKRYKARRAEDEDIQRANFKTPRSPQRLRQLLELVPGIAEGKGAWAENLAKANPAIVNNPQELWELCISGLNMQPFAAKQVVQAFFSDVINQPNPQGPQFVGGAPWMQPTIPQGPQVQYQALQTPQGVQYVPVPYSQAQPVQVVQGPVQEQPEEAYVETHEPVIGPDGKPVIGPNGQIVMRTIRRPANAPADPMQQMAAYAGFFQTLGLMGSKKTDVEELAGLIERAIERVAPKQQSQPVQDPMLIKIMGELEATRARMETQDKYGRILDQKDQALHAKEIEAAIAKSGMKAEDLATVKIVEAMDKGLGKFMDNFDKRTERMERTLIPLARQALSSVPNQPLRGGVESPLVNAPIPMPMSEADLAPLTPKPVQGPPVPELETQQGYRSIT